jgi:hypothetical protein
MSSSARVKVEVAMLLLLYPSLNYQVSDGLAELHLAS